MNQAKALLGIAVTLAFMSMPVALLINPMIETTEPDFSGYRAEFIGQDTAVVGELVRFLAEGDIVRWECLPLTNDSQSYGEHNENYLVSFRRPGVYTIVAAIYVEGDLSIHTQIITVEGGAPVNPIDPVGPTPDPAVDLDRETVGKVEGWCQKYKVDKDTCNNLAVNFEKVAEWIEAGKLITTPQIVSKTAELNADLSLNENLMAELQAYLTSKADLGGLSTPEQHLLAWKSIAKGLRNAAN